jgi:8-oxo-dGTP pyrophosphatase MutT (NUDIX family)/phosphohistidine phosphatase SixA
VTPRPDDKVQVRAAGAVVWREGAGGLEIAVVHRPRYGDWSFPKGKLDPGEHPLAAAVREVAEETGLAVRLGRRLPTVGYLDHFGRRKQVDYWAATAAEDTGFQPNDEVDRLDWLAAEPAADRLSYPHDREVLRALTAEPHRTVPYIVLRHGSAGDKHHWPAADELRPLDDRGRLEATALAELLAAYAPARVIGSATARCVETLLPYALRHELDIATDLAFTVGHTGPGAALARMIDLVGAAVPAVVCTHGEVVSGLMTELCTRLGGKTPDDPALRKAGLWVLHVAADTIVSLERHHP